MNCARSCPTPDLVSESNFFEWFWQQPFWSPNYPRLQAVKAKYEPAGLLFVRHRVGSQERSARRLYASNRGLTPTNRRQIKSAANALRIHCKLDIEPIFRGCVHLKRSPVLDRKEGRGEAPRRWGKDPTQSLLEARREAFNPQFLAKPPERRWQPVRFSTRARAFGLWLGTALLLVMADRWPWLGITLLLVMAYAYRNEISNLGDRLLGLLLPFRGYSVDRETASYFADLNGQFCIDGRANGIKFAFLLDTGAGSIVFNKADGRRRGFDPSGLRFDRTVWTANGPVRAASVRLRKLEIGQLCT